MDLVTRVYAVGALVGLTAWVAYGKLPEAIVIGFAFVGAYMLAWLIFDAIRIRIERYYQNKYGSR